MYPTKICVSLATLLASAGVASAVNLLSPGDFVIAIDTDAPGSASNFPGGESPALAIDGTTNTKYLNFAGQNSGFIVTPAAASVVQSVNFTTANDAEGRDPASFQLYGTNAAITSTNNSLGNGESWALIGSSALSLPSARLTVGTPVDVTNGNSYLSYRIIFDELKNNADVMQIDEVQFFAGAGGSGSSIIGSADPILAIDIDEVADSGFPGGESPGNAIDGGLNKYLNFGAANSGLILTPAGGASIVNELTITTGGDAEERDPASFSVYGTNDAITSVENSRGDAENWILIDSGSLALPADRDTVGDTVSISNSTAYESYRVVFDSLKNEGAANSMQIAELQLGGTFVPEPSSALLALLAAGSLLLRRRR